MTTLLAHLGVSGVVPTRGGVLPLWSGKGTAWSHKAGVVSCGDAAGLVDPISGEGLTAALVSGKRAGEAVASFLSGNFGALDGYSRWVRDLGAGALRAVPREPGPRGMGRLLLRSANCLPF